MTASRGYKTSPDGENYVVHIPRQYATPQAGIFTLCGRRVTDVNSFSNDKDAQREIGNSRDIVCRSCLRLATAVRKLGIGDKP